MSKIKEFLANILNKALQEVKMKGISIYTIAFYHDHESKAVSICIDTKENSDICVAKQKVHYFKYFQEAIKEKNLKSAALWFSDAGGRNISLGDFTLDAGYTYLGDMKGGKSLYLAMIEVLMDNKERIAELSDDKEEIVFLTSGADYEVQYKWRYVKG